ncbi:MAG: fimbrillin family protein, partial [Alistipes senegalensis]|nr:fimbrillin family protein [Bacteroides cellulosilyticus]MCM1352988.1 fimbrillin family protein [Alistipes senegalensis]
CSKSDVETRPVVAGDVEIVSGSKVSAITRAPFEGTLDDKANNKLTAYVYATKLDVANSNAYVSYDAAQLAAEGYMTFVSAAMQDASSKYPVAAVGFQKYDDSTPAVLVADPQYYPSNDNPLYMVGLVPAVKVDWTMDADSKVATHVIDGKTDIMAAAVTKMNDGTAIQKTKASATVYPAFNFTHKLTLVNVKVYTPTQKEQAAWGKITKIELVTVNGVADGVHNKCDVTLETGVAAWSGADAGNVTPFYAYNTTDKYTDKLISTDDDKTADADANYGAVEIATAATAEGTATDADAQYVAYSMIAPFTTKSTGSKITNMVLKVYTEKHEDGIEAPIAGLYESSNVNPDTGSIYAGSTEGKKFDVTLKFIGKEIVASATVTDWIPVYADEVVIQ